MKFQQITLSVLSSFSLLLGVQVEAQTIPLPSNLSLNCLARAKQSMVSNSRLQYSSRTIVDLERDGLPEVANLEAASASVVGLSTAYQYFSNRGPSAVALGVEAINVQIAVLSAMNGNAQAPETPAEREERFRNYEATVTFEAHPDVAAGVISSLLVSASNRLAALMNQESQACAAYDARNFTTLDRAIVRLLTGAFSDFTFDGEGTIVDTLIAATQSPANESPVYAELVNGLSVPSIGLQNNVDGTATLTLKIRNTGIAHLSGSPFYILVPSDVQLVTVADGQSLQLAQGNNYFRIHALDAVRTIAPYAQSRQEYQVRIKIRGNYAANDVLRLSRRINASKFARNMGQL